MASAFQLDSNSVAIITGASSGIGRATALALSTRCVRVALLARSAEKLAELAAQYQEMLPLACDVRDETSVNEAIAVTLARWGRIDVLINSAGLSLNGDVDGYALDDWRTVLDTNLTGTFLTCRAVLPTMKRQNGGQIINISSGAGRNGIKQMAAYCAAKFGVIGFTESFGLEVRQHNIRVSALLPGSVATDFSRVAKRAAASNDNNAPREIGYSMTADEVATVIVAMLEQPAQAWSSEVVLRPLNLELRRTEG
jgi:NADP-dependent 3-hydroxy acid dehydrogenase YdfG